ncbi:saccharopine dehydrogenase NADP-binding domain-containing protein [Flavobacteriales bacterium]|nr:saccharopine dehydrogenase NADP-binding domain-containing protein [Flavobacteriales bacterium]
MRKIFLIGAGRSASSLIKYLLDNAVDQNWHLTVGDLSLELAREKISGAANAEAIQFDINDEIQRVREIGKADIVISMLPASMHVPVARDCIALGKSMVTASYVSPEMKALDEAAKDAGVVLMNEIGVDPGIDHLSAMKVLDEIRDQGGKMLVFESFTGGLVAPESDNNPWNYKFTWNPRNVVLAGQGSAAKFYQEGRYKYIPYNKLFRRTETIEIEGYGKFEGYANRDSLGYREVYRLNEIPTIYRGTLRRPGYCRAWDAFVQLGATDDSYVLEGSEDMTYRQFINSFLPYNPNDSVELKLKHYLRLWDDSPIFEKLEWLGIFSEKKVGLKDATPAQILQKILEEKWSLDPDDKDMLVMWHKFGFELNGKKVQKESSMVCIGDDQTFTAMAKTVGIPVAIATKLILNKVITTPGVHVPVTKEIYNPMLQELSDFGIRFAEKETAYQGY